MATVMGGVTFRDDRGLTAKARFFSTYGGGGETIANGLTRLEAVATALVACSNAEPASSFGVLEGVYVSAAFGADANYESCSDVCHLTFGITDSKSLVRISIPAPKETIFQADGLTPDSADTTLAALITAVQDNAANQDGLTGLIYKAGRRIKRNRKQLNSSLKSAALT